MGDYRRAILTAGRLVYSHLGRGVLDEPRRVKPIDENEKGECASCPDILGYTYLD